jgi:hypothetical protein
MRAASTNGFISMLESRRFTKPSTLRCKLATLKVRQVDLIKPTTPTGDTERPEIGNADEEFTLG